MNKQKMIRIRSPGQKVKVRDQGAIKDRFWPAIIIFDHIDNDWVDVKWDDDGEFEKVPRKDVKPR